MQVCQISGSLLADANGWGGRDVAALPARDMVVLACRAPPVRGQGLAHLSVWCDLQPPFLPDRADVRRQEKEAPMPARQLPREPTLEHLRNQAKALRRGVQPGDTAALGLVREFHPRLPGPGTDRRGLAAVTLAGAQLVIARQYGFDSWPKLRRHVEVISRYARSPHHAPAGGPVTTESARAEEFLRLACLTYGDDDAARRQQARELLAAHPQIATASIHTVAAVGDVAAAAALLADDPAQASARG